MPRVTDNTGNFEKLMRKFKKRVTDSGLLQEVRERETYTKPCIQRKMAKNAARRRWRKYLASQQLPERKY